MAATVLSSSVSPSTRYYQFEALRTPSDGASPISRWMSFAYDYEDQAASKISVHVPPGSMVLRTRHRVEEAWTGVSAITVGDGDAADGWIAGATITPGTAGDFVGDTDSTNEAAGGKFYEDGDTIDIAFTGIASAGSGKLFIEVISYHEALAEE